MRDVLDKSRIRDTLIRPFKLVDIINCQGWIKSNFGKRQLVESNMLKWPKNCQKILDHTQEVFMQQIKLVKRLKLCYKSDSSKQNIKKNGKLIILRIAAIDKLSISKGSHTPGIDNISLTSRKEDERFIYKFSTMIKRYY